MIAKRLSKKADVPDNYTRLAEYIAAAEDKGEKLDRFWIANCDAGTELDDLDTALAEIEAVRKMKPKVDDKTYHLVVSLRPEDREKLSAEDLTEIASQYVKALGFDGHQYVAGTHVNTDNFHMHVAINRVNPATLKIHAPFRDFVALENVSRKVEQRYGLAVDRGMSDREKNPLSPQARDFEHHTWQQSFQRHMQDHREEILGAVAGSPNWQSLHQALADFDVTLRKRGNGLVFVNADGKQAMKASALDRSCSKSALEKRLGPFEPRRQDRAASAAPKISYKAQPLLNKHPATSRLWKQFMGMRSAPGKGSTLFGRVAANWKMFLLTEAYNDPLAMVLIVTHQEMLGLLFGGDTPAPTKTPRQTSKLLAPALAAWREKGRWQNGGTVDRPSNSGVASDEAGNLVVPIRNTDNQVVGLRVIAKDGRVLDLGAPGDQTRKSRGLGREEPAI